MTETDRLTADRVPFVLVAFSDGRTEVFERCDADVFGRGILVITAREPWLNDRTYEGGWLRATAYDAQGYPLYEHRAGNGAAMADDARERVAAAKVRVGGYPQPLADRLTESVLLPLHRAFVAAKVAGSKVTWDEYQLDHARAVLKAFYQSELSLSTLQPVLDLAVALNPDVRR